MLKAKTWNGRALKGDWEVTLKVDGVRAFWDETRGWLSRADKPLYNIPPINLLSPQQQLAARGEGLEVYLGNFRDTIRAVRTQTLKEDTPRIKVEHLYCLGPLDDRLLWTYLTNPTAEVIQQEATYAILNGYEGLILRQGEAWLKVKPEETHDMLVLGVIEGTGKHAGRMGALITSKGEVGTGFSDKEREYWWHLHVSDSLTEHDKPLYTIEVSCMHLTEDGKFRHPSFVRDRTGDKAATA